MSRRGVKEGYSKKSVKKYLRSAILILIATLWIIVSPGSGQMYSLRAEKNVEEFNIWLSNPVKEKNSAIVVSFSSKIEIETPFCFLITLKFPDITSFGIVEDYEKETDKIEREKIRKIIVSNTYINSVPFKELEYPLVYLPEYNEICISGLFPYETKFNELRFYFSDLLKISFKSSGKYTIKASISRPQQLYTYKITSNKFIIFDTLP